MDYSKLKNQFKTVLRICEPPARYGYDFDNVTFTNWYMYSSVVKNEKIAKKLTELIWNVKIKETKEISNEKTIITGGEARDVRLDLLVVDKNDQYFVVEMENKKRKLMVRGEYYAGAVNFYALRKGENYEELKGTFISFICTSDPFDKGNSIYDIEPLIKADNGEVDSNNRYRFINVSAYEKEENKELREFMAYCDHEELSDNELVQMIHKEVRKLRNEEDWRNEYMKFEEILEARCEESEEKGMARGLKKGMIKGMEKGMEKGIAKGMESGLIKGKKEGLMQMLMKILKTKFKLENFDWIEYLDNEQLNEITVLASVINEKDEFERELSKFKVAFNY